MTQATIASKSHYCKLPLPLSLWEAVAERLWNGGGLQRWMESGKEATDVGDAGVARAVGSGQRWQMYYQRHLHPC